MKSFWRKARLKVDFRAKISFWLNSIVPLRTGSNSIIHWNNRKKFSYLYPRISGQKPLKMKDFLRKWRLKVNFRAMISFWLDSIVPRQLVVTLLYIRTSWKYFSVPLAAYFGPKLPKNEGFLKKMEAEGQFSSQDKFFIGFHCSSTTGGDSIIH